MDTQDGRDARTELLQSLASCYEDYKDFNPRKVEGTCEWFFDDDTFRTWRESNTSALLWVSAGPGCGKSVLSRAMIDESWRLSSGRITPIICYFFFKDGNEDQMTGTGALRAILHQLLAQDTTNELMKIALRHFKTHGKNLMLNFSALWNVLIECARSCHLVCVLDALDECETESRRKLIDKLLDHFQSLARGSNASHWVKFLITSRPYDDLEASFRPLTSVASYLRLDGDDKHTLISADIDRVIDARLEDITNGFKKEHRDAISHRLKSAENRTYLWLYLTFDIIQRSPSEYGRLGDIEGLLSTIPSQVSDAYECILQRSKDRERATILLQIVLAAMQPLTLDEANIALTSALTNSPYRAHTDLCDALWPREIFKVVVRNMCGLFISVYDSKLFLIHQTAREFLVGSNRQSEWGGRLKLTEAHMTMLQVCQRYLSLEDLRQQYENAYRNGTTKDHFDDEFPFLPYAARNWITHCRLADRCVTDQAARGVIKLFEGPYWRTHDGTVGLKDCALALASGLGLGSIVEYMLAKENVNVNGLGEPGQCSALYVASVEGYTVVVRILLEHGAHVDMVSGRNGDSAFLSASAEGNVEVMKLLLKHHADVNFQNNHGESALHLARTRSAVQLLLENGANIDIQNKHGESALHLAIRHSYYKVKVAQLLLENGANINIQNKYGESALHLAISHSYPEVEVVQLLLENGANIDIQNKYGESALHLATTHSACKVVQLLLENGANIDIQNKHGESALHLAISHSYSKVKVAQLLLENGANIDIQNKYGESALHLAAADSACEVAQLLLDRGASIDIQNQQFETALQVALGTRLRHTYEADGYFFVKSLLARGTDVNLQDECLAVALHRALKSGNEDIFKQCVKSVLHSTLPADAASDLALKWGLEQTVFRCFPKRLADVDDEWKKQDPMTSSVQVCGDFVQILIEKGANVFIPTPRYGTTLQVAIVSKVDTPTIRLLLDKGVSVDQLGGSFGTALQIASRLGRAEVVELLLDKGADINLQGGRYDTALCAASYTGNVELIEALLQRGAEINPQGPNSGTALQVASRLGSVEIVRLLLNRGANAKLQGGPFGTALCAASYTGNVELVEALLESGAEINTPGPNAGTALQVASWSGYTGIVKILLERGADVNLEDQPPGTALQAAIRSGHVEIVRILLEHGAHVNTEAGRYGTTFEAVKYSGNPEIMRMLFINGVDTGPVGAAIRAAILNDLDTLPRYYEQLGFTEGPTSSILYCNLGPGDSDSDI